jgi:outer membrane lipase/esterase
MRQTNFALALLAAAVLTACGGSDNNNSAPAPKPTFASQVSFGDSLSDIGTYKVGTVAAAGGGTYTINGDNTSVNAALHGKNWTQLMATQLGFTGAKAPCPAWTGLTGNAAAGFSVPVVPNTACHSYAMGGARVTADVGPGNALTGSAIGQLTYPVVKQVGEYLTRNGGKFTGTEIVYVWAGGNDLLMLLGQLTAAATAAGNTAGAQTFITSLSAKLGAGTSVPATATPQIAAAMATALAVPGTTLTQLVPVAVTKAVQLGNLAAASATVYGPMAVAASTEATAAGTLAANNYAAANGPALVPLMGDAGTQLAAQIRNEMVAKGATHVVVNNLPDVATTTPTGLAQSASGKQLIGGMVSAFNIALRLGIDGLEDKVLHVDLFTLSQDQFANPAKYGISNATTAACAARPNFGTTSLFCNASSTLPGVDVSHYIFADDVHPAPYGQTLIAKAVADAMVVKGWL